MDIIIDRVGEERNKFGCVRPSVRPYVSTLAVEPRDS